MDRINVIIAENELSEREKLKGQLASEQDIQIVGEARDGKECLELVTRQRPDIVLIKEDLPVLNGLAAAEPSWWENYHSRLEQVARESGHRAEAQRSSRP